MASSDNILQILRIAQPLTLYATIDQKLGATVPKEKYIVYDFSDGTVEYLDFICRLDGYDGGGLDVNIYWSSDVDDSNAVVWSAGCRKLDDGNCNPLTGYAYQYNSVTANVATVSGAIDYATISFTDGADMDNWANGELGVIRVRRDGTDGSDTMGGDAQLWGIAGNEA